MPEQKGEILPSKGSKTRRGLPEGKEPLDPQPASKNTETERLLAELQIVQSKLPLLSARAQTAEAKASQLAPMLLAIDTKNDELATLSARNGELQALIDEQNGQIDVFKSEMERKMTEIERLRSECASLGETISALTVRTSDAESRRLEAYEFARISSDTAFGLRRELETLKRDLAEALDFPQESLSPVVEHRHRDIVESMTRLFPGTEATRYIARDPQVERVSRMALELLDAGGGSHSESARIGAKEGIARPLGRNSTLQKELDALKERAERAEAFASEWHEQIMTIRRSASWRWTKPFRALGRIFKA